MEISGKKISLLVLMVAFVFMVAASSVVGRLDLIHILGVRMRKRMMIMIMIIIPMMRSIQVVLLRVLMSHLSW